MKDFVTIGGQKYRVETNWNATVEFLAFKGTDDISALSDFGKLKPSDLAPLAAACINEGERLEGHDVHLTPADVGAAASMDEIAAFIQIFVSQVSPKTAPDTKKKD